MRRMVRSTFSFLISPFSFPTVLLTTPSRLDLLEEVVALVVNESRIGLGNGAVCSNLEGSAVFTVYKVDFGADVDFDKSNDNAVKAEDTDNYEKEQLYRIDFQTGM